MDESQCFFRKTSTFSVKSSKKTRNKDNLFQEKCQRFQEIFQSSALNVQTEIVRVGICSNDFGKLDMVISHYSH